MLQKIKTKANAFVRPLDQTGDIRHNETAVINLHYT